MRQLRSKATGIVLTKSMFGFDAWYCCGDEIYERKVDNRLAYHAESAGWRKGRASR